MFAYPPSADVLPPEPPARSVAAAPQPDARGWRLEPAGAESTMPDAWRSEAFYEDLPDAGSRALPVAKADWPSGAEPAPGAAPGSGWLAAGALAVLIGGAVAAGLGGTTLPQLLAGIGIVG
jgi:hypothetical protein